MNASNVHSVIAAGLEHPELLARWRQEPELLRGFGIDPDSLDLNALWSFAGLTAKVRHNGLRANLPMTFRLLNIAGLEIEVFASYASHRASVGAGYAETTEGRTRDLLSFLEGWLDFEKREHAMLWDLIRHELALTRLSKAVANTAVYGLGAPIAPRAASVPRISGVVILHEMRYDPRALVATLREKHPRLEEAPSGPFHFCYWRRTAPVEIHLVEMDELGFCLLSLADGRRSVSEMSRLLGGGRRPAKAFLNALGELASTGIIAFDPAES
jgi:hypothetical protein